jgi:5'-3' exonuclease
VITGWLIKIVVVIALIGVVIVEVGSPVITHAQVDGAAHDAADDAAAAYFSNHDPETAQQAAQTHADKEHATMESFAIDPDTGRVTVKLSKQARSFVLKKFSQTRKWTIIRVTASSTGPTK